MKGNNIYTKVSQKISHEHFILNYTPLKEEMRKFSDKIVLVSGFDSTADIMTHCELHNVNFSNIVVYHS